MEWTSNRLLLWILFVSFTAVALILGWKRNIQRRKLPPGPPGWPVFGNMFDLGTMPHRTLAELRQKYGHIVWLNFGAINTLAILSAKAATELFKNHDLAFAGRSITETMTACDFDKASISLSPYGPYWRVLRRLSTMEMVVIRRIKETESIRRRCVDDMLTWIEGEATADGGVARRAVPLGKFVFLMAFNMLGNLMLSRNLVNSKSQEVSEFFTAVNTAMEWSGHANFVDFFPWLKWLDPQGLKRNMERDLGKALEIASGFVKERVEEKQSGENKERQDFLDVLLEYQGNNKDEPDKISHQEINILILEIFIAGSETTSSTVEWAITELLRNPDKMTKVKDELTNVIGIRKVEEGDVNDLPYLQSVVKETFRLHPPIPFLVPRRAIQDTNFMGYKIPQNTQVLVNAWAIGRDPDTWDDPTSFNPERFIGSTVDYRGQHYQLIPFGAGRRMCAGVPLAHRVLHLVLGSLIHRYDWQLENTAAAETIDMRETLGITMRKLEPLKAIPNLNLCKSHTI